jgi:phosphatidate cytidylyltransferase
MAFNWQSFKTRTLTAAVFVIVMLTGLLWNHWSFFILFSVIHFGCWWEYLKLTEKICKNSFHIYTKLGLMIIGYSLMVWFCNPLFSINGYGLKENISLPISAAGFAILLIGIFQKNSIHIKEFLMAALGFLYISLSLGLMIDLYARSNFPVKDYKNTSIHFHDTRMIAPVYFYPAVIIASLWINDTMAYIMGSLIGKRQMSKISPKKTWEGTISGIILSAGVIFILSKFVLPFGDSSFVLVSIAVIASITGTFGDLLESKLKRMAGVKDSGQIMPGHGGFLDRFDSMLVAVPFVWLFVYLFMH